MKFQYILLLLVSITVSKEVTIIEEVPALYYVDAMQVMNNTTLRFTYDPQADTYGVYVNEIFGLSAFQVDSAFIAELKVSLDKYQEWNKKAIKDKVVISKEIKRMYTNKSFWRIGEEWFSANGSEVVVKFSSNSIKEHYLYIQFEKMESIDNEYITHDPMNIFLTAKQVKYLISQIDSKKMDQYKEKAQKRIKVESEFN